MPTTRPNAAPQPKRAERRYRPGPPPNGTPGSSDTGKGSGSSRYTVCASPGRCGSGQPFARPRLAATRDTAMASPGSALAPASAPITPLAAWAADVGGICTGATRGGCVFVLDRWRRRGGRVRVRDRGGRSFGAM